MKHKKTLLILVILITILSGIAALTGVMSNEGEESHKYESIRGETVEIYGRGIYEHMSKEVAIQGIAQDYVTLLLGIPGLIIALIFALRGSLKARFVLSGITGYFLVTYLFYTAMAMYNHLFLVYASLLGLSFFAFILSLYSFDITGIKNYFKEDAAVRFGGAFLVFNAVMIALLWLSVIIPPLLEGTVYPSSLEHYTTLIVQGFDLGLLLPAAVVTGILALRKRPFGYLFTPVYLVFLSLLMAALTAKLIAMGINGYAIVPAIFIIPVFMIVAFISSIIIIGNVNDLKTE
ncbi:MAG: hypothetical protein R6U31_07525 [bacterium]